MAHYCPQGLLLLVLLPAISKSIDGSSVLASQEEDVVLPCFDSNVMAPKSCYKFILIKYATNTSKMKVILARPQTPKIQDDKRVKWEADGNGQMSLFLTKLQKSDEGLYGCEVWHGWDSTVKNISLKVKDCKAHQAVKAAPSAPISLTCPVDIPSGQQGPQNISWASLKGGNPVLVNLSRAEFEINGTSLAIQSVGYSHGGWYRCNYTLGQTWRCFDINLLVQVENVVATMVPPALTTGEIVRVAREESSSGAFNAVVASVIIGIAIIAALIGLFVYCKHNTQRNTELTHMDSPVTLIDSAVGYETVNHRSSEDPTDQQVNSLYQQFQDGTMCTFQC